MPYSFHRHTRDCPRCCTRAGCHPRQGLAQSNPGCIRPGSLVAPKVPTSDAGALCRCAHWRGRSVFATYGISLGELQLGDDSSIRMGSFAALLAMVEIFKILSIKYVVGGSIASSIYGEVENSLLNRE